MPRPSILATIHIQIAPPPTHSHRIFPTHVDLHLNRRSDALPIQRYPHIIIQLEPSSLHLVPLVRIPMEVHRRLPHVLDNGGESVRSLEKVLVIVRRIGVSEQYHHSKVILVHIFVQYPTYVFQMFLVSFSFLPIAVRTSTHDIQSEVQHALVQKRKTLVEDSPSRDIQLMFRWSLLPLLVRFVKVLLPHVLSVLVIITIIDIIITRQYKRGYRTLFEDGTGLSVRVLLTIVDLGVLQIAQVE
mmetsp:Transcript_7826/g.16976  ORF Transcript_7826/g.16976 Transcript_7826/m.16976 type:complete len:243 (-) Transcript_7826:1644-2372(-)